MGALRSRELLSQEDLVVHLKMHRWLQSDHLVSAMSRVDRRDFVQQELPAHLIYQVGHLCKYTICLCTVTHWLHARSPNDVLYVAGPTASQRTYRDNICSPHARHGAAAAVTSTTSWGTYLRRWIGAPLPSIPGPGYLLQIPLQAHSSHGNWSGIAFISRAN